KATGVVTTTRVTHASPAANYAHSASRKWEHDTNGTKCEDIASQLVFGETGKNINVVLGGGRREFLPQMPHERESGLRNDRINLVKSWIEEKHKRRERANYVTTKEELMKLNDSHTNFVLGLFSHDHLEYNLDK
ncbi:Alkaline phosphatase: tissue-nonspecific isozyme-like protein, partial [Leptotrombidium deliense]